MNKYSRFFAVLVLIITSIVANSQINERGIEQEWKTNKTNRSVDLDEFRVLLVRDGIPPLDEPVFWSVSKAKSIYFEHEPAIVYANEKHAKAYPLSILTFHEIVNDEAGDDKFSVTYCPLCNAGIVFNRFLEHNGKDYLLDFGVSGMLRGSDLVMWDRQTETW
jgi:hypothetical protein